MTAKRVIRPHMSTNGVRPKTRRAMVLIIVLVVVAALSLGALTFSALMVSEREVVNTTGRRIQATALAESGIEAARLFLSEYADVRYAEGIWYEDTESFQGVTVCDEGAPRDRGRFAIVAPVEDDFGEGIRFGLECESGKLNLNTLLDEESGNQDQEQGGTGSGESESEEGSGGGAAASVEGLGGEGASEGRRRRIRARTPDGTAGDDRGDRGLYFGLARRGRRAERIRGGNGLL